MKDAFVSVVVWIGALAFGLYIIGAIVFLAVSLFHVFDVVA